MWGSVLECGGDVEKCWGGVGKCVGVCAEEWGRRR